MLKSWWFVNAADRKCARKLNVTNLVDESALGCLSSHVHKCFRPKHDVGPNDLSVDERILFVKIIGQFS